MPRVSGEKDYISLTQGLITEASPLAFPEGSTADEKNFLLDVDGMVRKRRKGFENLVSDFTYSNDPDDTYYVENFFYWEAPDVYLVVITGFGPTPPDTVIRIHRNDVSYSIAGTYVFGSGPSVTEIADNTNLVNIVSAGEKPLLLEYDEAESDIKIYDVDLFVRDFELVDDGLRMSERPSTLSDEHNYNLLNAGWYAERRLSSSGTKGDPIADFNTAIGEYPSNADIPFLGLKTDEDGNEEFDPETLDNISLGNTEAPRGHYVFNINSFDRNDKLTSPDDDGTESTTITLQSTISL